MTTLDAQGDTGEPAGIAVREKLRFSLREFAGGLGDLGTFLPLAAAMAATNRMDLGAIFLFAGIMNIATGLMFRQPIPVQPMKAIAAVAIAEGLSHGAIAASGIALGVTMTTLALIGAVGWINRVVPRPVIRGIQAGVGAKLALLGISWVVALPATGIDSIIIACAIAAGFIIARAGRIPIVLIVFAGGLAVAAFTSAHAMPEQIAGIPSVALILPTSQDWFDGITRGAIPQLPLTMLNSVIAVCALSGDLFPKRAIEPRRMALSVGLINLMCVPFGGMPMCHGAGGLAAQHRFGARSGGSVVMLGTAKIIFAFALGGALLPLIDAYPRSVLGVMLVFAGFALMKPARESLASRSPTAVMIATALAVVFLGTLEGVIIGGILAAIFWFVTRARCAKA